MEACWAHNPEVRGSKPRSARNIFLFFFTHLIPFNLLSIFDFYFLFFVLFCLNSTNSSQCFLFNFQEGLSEDDLDRLDEIYKKLYVEKYPKVGYVEGHEPQHEDNLTVKRKKNIEL